MRSGTSFAFTFLTLTSCFVAERSDEQSSTVSQGARVRGAIFTTLADGSAVNHNIYDAKADVYLDGGPQGGSPSGAAALDEGDYYFQVTDPSGKTLLSSDAIECRRVHVNGDGVISAAVGACRHTTGVDQDYASLGAITVQLMPYADTPNNGGVYKVWITPVAAYVGGGYTAGVSYGFVPAFSKTDVFKVRDDVVPPPDDDDDTPPPDDDDDTPPPPPPPSCVCGDGHLDAGEQCDDGNTTNGDGCSSSCQTETSTPPDDGCHDSCDGDGGGDGGGGGGHGVYTEPLPDVTTLQTKTETIFVP